MERTQARAERLTAFHGMALVSVAAQLVAVGVGLARRAPTLLLVAFFFGLLGIITLLPLF